jgi:hypothetical protein
VHDTTTGPTFVVVRRHVLAPFPWTRASQYRILGRIDVRSLCRAARTTPQDRQSSTAIPGRDARDLHNVQCRLAHDRSLGSPFSAPELRDQPFFPRGFRENANGTTKGAEGCLRPPQWVSLGQKGHAATKGPTTGSGRRGIR